MKRSAKQNGEDVKRTKVDGETVDEIKLYDEEYMKERKAELDAQGYTAFEDMLTRKERAQFIALFNDWLTSRRMVNGNATGADMDYPHTFAIRSEALPVSNIHGIEKYQIGQARMMWFLRMHPRVLQVYAFLHGCAFSDLVTSLDGACILSTNVRGARPTGKGGVPAIVEAKEVFGWLHLDQGNQFVHSTKATCYQGFYNYDDTSFASPEERTMPTFACIPRGHMVHTEFVNAYGVEKDNWHRLSTAQYAWYTAKGMKAGPVSIAKNAFFVWDSRLPHQNLPCYRVNSDLLIKLRRVAYISMLPASTRTAKDVANAPKFYGDEKMTTCHWAGYGAMKANAKPRIYSEPMKELVPEAASHTLVSYEDVRARFGGSYRGFMSLYDSLTLRTGKSTPELVSSQHIYDVLFAIGKAKQAQ